MNNTNKKHLKPWENWSGASIAVQQHMSGGSSLGETSFPHLGYKVAPSACTAVMWNNTIHSEDCTEGGQKPQPPRNASDSRSP
eukprot:588726-Amphidinium_carterae.1